MDIEWIFYVIYVLAIWFYFFHEGITEGFTWKNSKSNNHKNSRWYHLMRVRENVGILIAVLILISIIIKATGDWTFLWLFLFSMGSGLSVYEMIYSDYVYGDMLYNKTSKWIGIKHPKGWVWVVVFIFCTIAKIFIIINKNS